ncbi:hypothetical protein Q6I89_004328 [Salmonella enterica]|nr:hypothetical protein [Salmonella enterica]EJT3914026.1 hypothetical protein [Salmonella enterica]ELL1509968.1 hypothetical protein [Salmonella enterica]
MNSDRFALAYYTVPETGWIAACSTYNVPYVKYGSAQVSMMDLEAI